MQNYYAPSSNRVRLDDYICDLNLEIAPGGYACYPLSAEGFSYMWGGCKATYGIRTGKVCFEVKITDYCDVTNKDVDTYVTRIGWSTDSATLQLGEDKNSFGFGGTGKKSVNRKFANYGRRFEKGDVVGCYLAMENGWVDISYSVNGRYCGSAFKIRWMTDEALFPHIMTKNCKLEVNFGQAPHPYFSLQPGYKLIDHVPPDFRISAVRPPTTQSDCEIIMMVGLPGVGKSTWAMNYAKIHPSKKYVLLGTDSIIDKMRVLGLPRKNNFGGRWDVLIKQASDCFNVLLKKASNLPINLILDQTNVYSSARRRKVKQYREKGYTINAMVLVPRDEDMIRRSQQRTIEEGKEVPESAVLDMKANFSLPDESEHLFDSITFLELQRPEAQMLVEQYNAMTRVGDENITSALFTRHNGRYSEAMSKGHRSNVQKQQGGGRSNDRYHRFPPSTTPRKDDHFRPPAPNSRHDSSYGNRKSSSTPSKWEDDFKGSKKRPESSDFGPPEKFRRSKSPASNRNHQDPQSYYGSETRQPPYGSRDSSWDRNQGSGRSAAGGGSGDARPDERNSYQQTVARQPPPQNESTQQPWDRSHSDVKQEPNRYDVPYPGSRESGNWQGQNTQNTARSYYKESQLQQPYRQEPSYDTRRSTEQSAYPRPSSDTYPNYGNQQVKNEPSNADNWPQNSSQARTDTNNFPPDSRSNYPQDNQYNKTGGQYPQSQQNAFYGEQNSSYSAPKREPAEGWGGYGDAYSNNQYQQSQSYNSQNNVQPSNSTGFDPNAARNPSQPWQDAPRQGNNAPLSNNNMAERRGRPMEASDQNYTSDSYQRSSQLQDNQGPFPNSQQGYYESQQQQYVPPPRDAQPYRPQFSPSMNQGSQPQQTNAPPPSSFQDQNHGRPLLSSAHPHDSFSQSGGGLNMAPGTGGREHDRGSQGGNIRTGSSWDQSREGFGTHGRNGPERTEEKIYSSDYENRGRPPASQNVVPPAAGSYNNAPYDNRPERKTEPRQPEDWQSSYNRGDNDKLQPEDFGQQPQIPPGPDSRRSIRSPRRNSGQTSSPPRGRLSNEKDRRSIRGDRERSPRSGRSRIDDSRSSRRDERDSSRTRGRDGGDRPRGSIHRDDRRDSSRSRNDDRRRSPHSRRGDTKSSRSDSDRRDDRREGSRSRRDDRRSRNDDKSDQRHTRDNREPSQKSDRSIAKGDSLKSIPKNPPPSQDKQAPLISTPPTKRDGLLPSPSVPLSKNTSLDRAGLSNEPPNSTGGSTISKLASVDFDKLKASLASIRRQNLEAPREETPPNMKIEYGGDMDVESESEAYHGNEELTRNTPQSFAPGGPAVEPNLHGAPMMNLHGPRVARPSLPRMPLLGEAPVRVSRPRGPRPPALMDIRMRGMARPIRPRQDESMANLNRPRRPLLETPILGNDAHTAENEQFYEQVEQEILESGEAGYGRDENYYQEEVPVLHQAPNAMRPRLRVPRPLFGGRRMSGPGMRGMRPQGGSTRPRMCTTFGLRAAARPLMPRGPPGHAFPPRLRPM